MAAKRPPSKTQARKPASNAVKPPAKPAAEPVIQRTSVASQPSPAELRAEREPAVDVAVGKPRTTQGYDDWEPAPQQMSWWERVKAALRGEREPVHTETMAEQMAVVKAGVLQELETMGVKKGIAVKGSPFATVMLPTAKPKRSWKWPLVALAVLVMVGLMVWVGTKPDTPQAVLGQAMAAVRGHDVRTFENKVDVASVATSIVNQTFNVPAGSGGPLTARVASFVKPGLAESLKDEILAAVGGEELDDSGNTLLGRLWHAMGAEKVRFGAARVAMQDPHLAVAELPLVRSDLGLTLPLQVVMTKSAESDADWQVVDMPNLATVLESIGEAERMLEERRAQAQPREIRVESVRKAKGGSAANSNLMVSMVVVNGGAADARDVQLELAFGDAAGQPMMTTYVTLDGVLAAGASREQVWSVPIDRNRAVERYVADLPLSALTVKVRVVQ